MNIKHEVESYLIKNKITQESIHTSVVKLGHMHNVMFAIQ